MNSKEVIKLFLNEDVHTKLGKALRHLTFNRGDYARFHKRYAEHGWQHCGIIVSEQYPIGELLRRMLNLLMSLSVQDMRNRLEYLSQWGEAIS